LNNLTTLALKVNKNIAFGVFLRTPLDGRRPQPIGPRKIAAAAIG